MARPTRPTATYRLQLRPGFGFAEAAGLVPYLRALGISHVYASPVFAARPGSVHGYDVVDPTRLNPDLGDDAEFRDFVRAVRGQGLGLLLDIVPNHMSASEGNAWWADVLKRGESSPYSRFFDVDWQEGGGRVVDWRAGPAMTNYRRFFAIDDLVGVRVEDPDLFDVVHSLALRLVRNGTADGLRIDHVDGLYDPLAYLRSLRREAETRLYVVVEKIVSGEERIPNEWPVQGTTGYDFLNVLNSVFVEPRGYSTLESAYRRYARRRGAFADTVYERKRAAAIEQFIPEVRRLARRVKELADKGGGPVLSEDIWREALVEVSSCLPVYRTYIRSGRVAFEDGRRIEYAVKEARRRAPSLDRAALRFLNLVLLLDAPGGRHSDWLEFVMRWQQVTGGVMAKGLEDSALYRHTPLASMNEVDADPRGPKPSSIDEFHRWNAERLRAWPHTMNATSTHDTKRSEDVRARINVLSEMPDEWSRAVRRWHRINARHRTGDSPCANEEWLLYQTLAGAWPLDETELPAFQERIKSYMVKAARESAERTSWLEPNEAYEAVLSRFMEALFLDRAFLSDLAPIGDRVAWYGMLNSLSQITLKACSPGVPDFYQGNELWDLSLVDPDNRRPVEFPRRREAMRGLSLRDLKAGLADVLRTRWRQGEIKMYVTARALALRREYSDVFARGDYVPVYASGWARQHVVAFARRRGRRWAIVVAPRFVTKLTRAGEWPLGREVWRDARLRLPENAPSRWRNVLTGEELDITATRGGDALELSRVLLHLPVALLMT